MRVEEPREDYRAFFLEVGDMARPNLKIPDVEQKIGKSHWTIRNLIKRGELPAYRISGEWHFDEAELDSWLAARHQPGRSTRLPEVSP